MRPKSLGDNIRSTEALDRLSKRFGKYALVVGVAKRAHDLKERARPLGSSGGGLVNRAIDEIAGGTVKLRGNEPEEDGEE